MPAGVSGSLGGGGFLPGAGQSLSPDHMRPGGACLGQRWVPEHVPLLSTLLTLSLSLCLSLSLSRSCRRHFCDLQLVIWLQLHSHKSDRWQPCLLHGACREPCRRLALSFAPHWTTTAPLGVLPLLRSPGWAPKEPGSVPCPSPFPPMVPIAFAPLGKQGQPCARSEVHVVGCPLPSNLAQQEAPRATSSLVWQGTDRFPLVLAGR